MKLVYLEWCDATSNAGWFDKDELEAWSEQTTWIIKEAGWLIKETKKYLVFANGWKPDDGWVDEKYVGVHKIPKTWVLNRKDLSRYIK